MNTNLTDITVILDRSESMRDLASETMAGYNRFIREQQEAPGECRLSLNQFNHKFERLRICEPIANARFLDSRSYVPGGNTALLDAIGFTITETGQRLAATPEEMRPARVLIVISTDGEENASRRYHVEKIRQMIDHQSTQYNWQFIFLASDLGAIQTAMDVGIAPSHILHKAANATGETDSYRHLSSNIRHARTAEPAMVAACMAFTDVQRDEQDDARKE